MSSDAPNKDDPSGFHGIFAKLSGLDIYDVPVSDLYGSGLADFYDRFVCDFVGDIPVFQRLLPCVDARVLDLACGSGRIGIPLARAGAFVDGIELSADMLVLAEEHLAKENPETRSRLRFFQGDMCHFTLPQKYDLIIVGVTSISLLLTSEQRTSLFEEVARHLKPGGKFVFDILDFSEERWKKFDNHMDVWSKEVEDGHDFAIIGQRFFPESKLFTFNVYREFISWDGSTKRTIGSSTKAWLERDDLVEALSSCGLTLIEEFHQGDLKFFVTQLAGNTGDD